MLNNATLKDNASAVAPTGGTDIVFQETGGSITNGAQFQVTADSDFRTRRILNAKNRPSVYTNGSYSKAKREDTIIQPEIIDGAVVFNLIRISTEVHPLTPAAREFNLRMLGGQVLSDADFSGFWTTGSLS